MAVCGVCPSRGQKSPGAYWGIYLKAYPGGL